MNLDEQMTKLSNSMPDSWWTVHPQSTDILLVQFFFHQVRMYMHLPFMKRGLQSGSDLAYKHSTQLCMEAARQIMDVFATLSTAVDGVKPFDCQTTAFATFTAAVVLLIGLSGETEDFRLQHRDSDVSLILSTLDAFRATTFSKGPSSQVSVQCRAVLLNILAFLGVNVFNHGPDDQSKTIRIPYFGTVVLTYKKPSAHPSPVSNGLLKNGRQVPSPSVGKSVAPAASSPKSGGPTVPHDAQNSNHVPSLSNSVVPAASPGPGGPPIVPEARDIPIVEYLGYRVPGPILGVPHVGFQPGWSNFNPNDGSQLPEFSLMDIDQSWEAFPYW
jgi:hypothetical protein